MHVAPMTLQLLLSHEQEKDAVQYSGHGFA